MTEVLVCAWMLWTIVALGMSWSTIIAERKRRMVAEQMSALVLAAVAAGKEVKITRGPS